MQTRKSWQEKWRRHRQPAIRLRARVGIFCNAGPLISLARIGRLDLLPALFGEIIVPPAVYREVTNDVSLPGARDLANADWLKLIEVQDRSSVERLLASLDSGEAEVLILAR